MWISVPISDTEMKWIERIGGPWRVSDHNLYRHSNVELALVTTSSWEQWGLPKPAAPILSIEVKNEGELQSVLREGAFWEKPPGKTAWGKEVGFLRFPSGLIVEVAYASTKA